MTEVRVTAERSDDILPSPPTPTPSITPANRPSTQGPYPQHAWSCHSDGAVPGCPSSTTALATSPFATISSVSSSRGPPQRRARDGWTSRLARSAGRFAAKIRNLDPVKLAYLRTSFVFAISVLVTWTPSSINRVYTLVYPRRFNFGLNLASALVLPLQGLWNAVIYCATSWPALRDEVGDLRARIARRVAGGRAGRGGRAEGSASRYGWAGGGRREVELRGRAATVRVFRGGSL